MKNARILIAANDDPAALHLERCLKSLGYTVCSRVSSGRQALEDADGTRPDLALVDLGLRGSPDAVEVADRIGSRLEVPVVCLAGGSGDEDRLRRTAESGNRPYGYVLKPFDEKQLHLNIQTALSLHERGRRPQETEGGETAPGREPAAAGNGEPPERRGSDELSRQIQLMKAVFESMSEGVAVIDAAGRLLLMNPTAEDIFGASDVERVEPVSAYDLFKLDNETPDVLDELQIERVLHGEEINDVEVHLRNRSNPEGLYLNVSGRPVEIDENGKRGGLLVFRDITRLKRTEFDLESTIAKLQRQIDLTNIVFDSISDGVFATDENGKYLMANATSLKITYDNMPNNDITKRPARFGFYHPDGSGLFSPDELPLQRAIRGEETSGIEMLICNQATPEGMYVSASGKPLSLDATGRNGGVVVFRDITEIKQAEADLKRTIDELRQQTKLMETVFDSMNEGVVVADKDGRLLLANRGLKAIAGMEIREMSPDQWSETYGIFYPDRETLVPTEELPLWRALQGEETDKLDFFVRNDNIPAGKYVNTGARPIYSEDGREIVGAVGIVHDVTEQRLAEDKLAQTLREAQDQADLMEAVFNSISDGVIVADAAGEFMLFNPGAERIVGVGMLDVPPDAWTDAYGIFYPDEKTRVPTDEIPLVRAIQGRPVEAMEVFIRNEKKPDGVHIQVSGQPLNRDISGPGGVVFFQDITDRKRAEERLRQTMTELQDQNDLMETTFNSISEGVIVADASGQYLYMNPWAERIVEAYAARRTGHWAEKPGQFFYPDRVTPIKNEDLPMPRAIFNGEAVDDEDIFIPGQAEDDGVYIRVSARQLSAGAGGMHRGVIIFRDVTDQITADEALTRAFAQGRLEILDTILHNIGNAINSVTIGIDTVQRSMTESRLIHRLSALADAVKAHQGDWSDYVLNDPQGRQVAPFIIALADDLARDNADLVKTVERVGERAQHIADIVRTQKALGNSGMDRKDISLPDALSDAVKVLQESLDKRSIAVAIDCENAPQEIRVQESPFNQMLVNLVKNSIEAIDERAVSGEPAQAPRIGIRAYVKGDFLNLEVSDNGIGIDTKKSRLIFAAGYTTKKQGSGLGLHSIANFVVGSGGQIHPLSDGIGHGATMRVMLRLSSVTSVEELARGPM